MAEGVIETTERIGMATSRANILRAAAVVGFFLLVSLGTYAADARYLYFSAYLWFGFVYGMSLQYGRFCMASAIRDLFAVGVPRMAVGIMIAVVLFSLVSAGVTLTGRSTFHASPIGLYSVVGGAIFGFGMVFTGGCATGSLYKTGEGSVAALLVVFSLSFAQAIFVDVGGVLDLLVPASWTASAAAKSMPAQLTATQGWYDQFLAGYIWDLKGLTVGEALGFADPVARVFIGNSLVNAILPALVLLAVIYRFYYRKGWLRKHADLPPGPAREFAGWWSMVTASRRTAVAGLVLGLAAGLQMWVMQALQQKFGIANAGELLTAMGITEGLSMQDTVFDPGYFYVTTQEAQGAAWVLAKLGMNLRDNIFFGMENGIPAPLANPVLWMSFSVIGGSMVMALLANEFKLKFPTREIALWAIGGGILMGLGSRVGLGCNIGAFFATVTNGDPSGWLFAAGMTAGGWLGVKFFNWWIERKMAKEAPLGF
ncbi:MAG: YeeE/YedE family protein [Betaproteobacteria bacterium]|nr:YeeE/YedE family protein [Betaproteobacteria bacterium]